MSNSCSLSSQHRHQAPSKRPISFPAQMEHNINGVRLPRSKLHQAAGNTCFDPHRRRVSAVLPRACWSSSPVLPHPLEVHTPSSGPLLASGTDADLMAAFHNEICLLCTGRAAPAWYPPGVAAGLQGTNSSPHTSRGTPLPRTPATRWLSLSCRVNGNASLAAGYQPRRRSGFLSPS